MLFKDMAFFSHATMVSLQTLCCSDDEWDWCYCRRSARISHGPCSLVLLCAPALRTRNESVQNRLAFFSVFTPFPEPRQDDYQIFRYALSTRYLRCVVWLAN